MPQAWAFTKGIMVLLFFLSVAEGDDLIGCDAGFEVSEEFPVLFVGGVEDEDDAFKGGAAVAIKDVEAKLCAVQDAEDGDVHLVLILTSNLIDEGIGLPVETALHEPDEVQGDEDDDGGECGWQVEARSAGHTDGGDDPDGGGAGESEDATAGVQDEASAKESDALDDVGGHLAFVGVSFTCENGREHSEKSCSEADEHVGAKAGGFAARGAFETDYATQKCGKEQTRGGAGGEELLVDLAEVREAWDGHKYGCDGSTPGGRNLVLGLSG